MSKVCKISKKKRNKANTVSFSHKKNRKFQQPNLQYKRFWNAEEGRWITLRVTTKVIKTITKYGLQSATKRYGTDPNILSH